MGAGVWLKHVIYVNYTHKPSSAVRVQAEDCELKWLGITEGGIPSSSSSSSSSSSLNFFFLFFFLSFFLFFFLSGKHCQVSFLSFFIFDLLFSFPGTSLASILGLDGC